METLLLTEIYYEEMCTDGSKDLEQTNRGSTRPTHLFKDLCTTETV